MNARIRVFVPLLALFLFFPGSLSAMSANTSVTITAVVPSTSTSSPVVPPILNGGGSGSGSIIFLPPTVTFSGRSSPLSSVYLLQDGVRIAATTADKTGLFSISLSTLQAGTYTFSLYARDIAGSQSASFGLSVAVPPGVITTIQNIFLPPTVAIDTTALAQNHQLVVYGYAAAASPVSISLSVGGKVQRLFRATAFRNGQYVYTAATAALLEGTYVVMAQAVAGGVTSSPSTAIPVYLSSQAVSRITGNLRSQSDINKDGKVDLADFSILAYWYNQKKYYAPADVNGDGVINLVDFSILAFNWNG